MQNQAEVNFSKWHFNSQFSKVNFQKSTVKSPIQRSNVKGQKWNYQSPISKDKFQTSNFKSSFQRQIFKAKLSKSNCHSNFQSQISKVNSRLSVSKSTTLWKSNNSNSNARKWNVSKSNFDRQAHFKSQHFPSQVKYSFRFDREQTKKKKFDSKIGLQFAFFLSRPSQPRKLSTSASEELAFNQLWRPEDSRQSSAGLFTSPVTCNVWLVEVKKPAWALVRRNVQELGEMWWASMRFPFYTHRSLPRSSLPFDVVIWHAEQAKKKTWRKKRKKHMVPNSR